jgi:Secretion system C-terminal sorting domain
MKKIIAIFALSLSVLASQAQVSNAMRATIVSEALNQVSVYAKSDVALNNVHVNNVIVSISIVDPGAGNRPTLSILTNGLPDCAWTPQPAYAEGGRWHYDFIANNNSNTPGVNTITWTGETHNRLLTLSFSNSNGFNTARIDNWDAPNWGAGFNSMFYFELIQAGNGDITAQNNLFYGSTGVVNDPGGFNSGTSFAPLQPLSVIPVKFVSFTVAKNNNDAVLTWKAENEDIRTDKYEVERSVNAADFTKIATVPAKANGLPSNTYELTDANVAAAIQNANGVVYYRVKQIDKDGKFVYTDIRNIRLSGIKGGFGASIFPNPVKDFATLNIDLTAPTDVTVVINDASGKILQNITLKGAIGGNTNRINMAGYAAGTYQVKVFAGTEMKNISVVKH